MDFSRKREKSGREQLRFGFYLVEHQERERASRAWTLHKERDLREG